MSHSSSCSRLSEEPKLVLGLEGSGEPVKILSREVMLSAEKEGRDVYISGAKC